MVLEQYGLKSLSGLLKKGETSILIGSSGVGKSTLINALSGMNHQAVHKISKRVNKGKHTTTHRKLFLLPNGSLLIDNPGMRELGLHDGFDSIQDVFCEIEILSADCRFNDCNHEKEKWKTIKMDQKRLYKNTNKI